ncbi:MAG: 4-phosphoerythronate dehydrogenase PdxB [Ignavibacteria bacterium]|nr:MAG: 4-phosphoerythronate dehydrogenase PdxB [Ignavibacteria bacterium]
MKLVVDENIAFAEEAFSQFGDVLLISGRQITKDILFNADALIIRSITNVDESLLQNTNIKFVGTATIGTDHIDTDYLNEHDIAFADAKGCNADSVAEYVFTALLKITVDNKLTLKNKSIGIIGVGNVGSRVAKYAEALGLKVYKNDPPKQRAGEGSNYVSLEEALQADIITLHVPLNKTGIDKTFYLLDEKKLNEIKNNTIIINSSRGAVIDNIALLNLVDKKHFKVILDVWEGEPLINTELLQKVFIGSAHVAGYSLEGKVNGTKMIYDALCRFANQPNDWEPKLPAVKNNIIDVPSAKNFEEKLHFIFKHIYDVETDDSKMRAMVEMEENLRTTHFDKLRKKYRFRREFNSYSIIIKREDKILGEILRKLRFKVQVKD